jgi:hypothetical protein
MCFITLITDAISVLAFTSQSASALQVQDSYRESSELSKRETTSSEDSGRPGGAGSAADGGPGASG